MYCLICFRNGLFQQYGRRWGIVSVGLVCILFFFLDFVFNNIGLRFVVFFYDFFIFQFLLVILGYQLFFRKFCDDYVRGFGILRGFFGCNCDQCFTRIFCWSLQYYFSWIFKFFVSWNVFFGVFQWIFWVGFRLFVV